MEVAHIIVHFDDTTAANKRLLFVEMDVWVFCCCCFFKQFTPFRQAFIFSILNDSR